MQHLSISAPHAAGLPGAADAPSTAWLPASPVRLVQLVLLGREGQQADLGVHAVDGDLARWGRGVGAWGAVGTRKAAGELGNLGLRASKAGGPVRPAPRGDRKYALWIDIRNRKGKACCPARLGVGHLGDALQVVLGARGDAAQHDLRRGGMESSRAAVEWGWRERVAALHTRCSHAPWQMHCDALQPLLSQAPRPPHLLRGAAAQRHRHHVVQLRGGWVQGGVRSEAGVGRAGTSCGAARACHDGARPGHTAARQPTCCGALIERRRGRRGRAHPAYHPPANPHPTPPPTCSVVTSMFSLGRYWAKPRAAEPRGTMDTCGGRGGSCSGTPLPPAPI